MCVVFGLMGCTDGATDPDGGAPPGGDPPGENCVQRCQSQASLCGAPASVADELCAGLCSNLPSESQLSCIESSSCSQLQAVVQNGGSVCGVSSSPPPSGSGKGGSGAGPTTGPGGGCIENGDDGCDSAACCDSVIFGCVDNVCCNDENQGCFKTEQCCGGLVCHLDSQGVGLCE